MRTLLALFVSLVSLASTAVLRADDSAPLRVRVLDRDGSPVYAAAVRLTADSGDFEPLRQLTDADGFAEFEGLAHGDGYRLTVTTLDGTVERRGIGVEQRVVDVRLGSFDEQGAPGLSLAGTSAAAPAPTPLRWISTPLALLDAATSQAQRSEALAATLGGRFSSSVLDGSSASATEGTDEPSFDTVSSWLRVSGSLVGGRSWYRLSQDVLRDEQPVHVGTGLEVQTTRQTLTAPRIAWQVSPSNQLTLEYRRYSLERDHLGLSSTVPVDATASLDIDSDAFALGWTAPVSTHLEVRSVLEWSEQTERILPSARGLRNECVDNPTSGFLWEAQCRTLDRPRSSGSHPLDVDATTEHLAAQSQVAVHPVRFLGSDHSLKAGFQVTNDRLSRDYGSRTAIGANRIYPDFGPDSAAKFVPEPVFLISARVPLQSTTGARARGVSWKLYAEDTLRPRDGLALTIGAVFERHERTTDGYSPFDPAAEQQEFLERLDGGADAQTLYDSGVFTAYEGIDTLDEDLERAIGFSPGEVVIGFPPFLWQSADWPRRRARDSFDLTSNDLSSYFSASWSPGHDGKTTLAFGASRRHDGIPLAALALGQGPITTRVHFTGEPSGQGGLDVNRLAGALGLQISTRSVSRDLRPPNHTEYLLSVERSLSTSTMLRLSWVDREYRDQLRSVDTNNLPGDFGRCQVDTHSGGYPYVRTGPIAESPGAGFELVDVYTGEAYMDTDPGVGDGRLDDCRGSHRFTPSLSEEDNTFINPLQGPDGRPDLYKQNPAWGEVVVVDSSGESDYEALVLELTRRPVDNWQFHGSYTWSRHRGNYDRLAAFDDLDPTLVDYGRHDQSDDRRHALRLDAITSLGLGFSLGATASWQSGLPYSILQHSPSFDALPEAYGSIFVLPARNRLLYVGERNAGRNPDQWLFDLLATRSFSLTRGSVVEVAMTVTNLFDDETYQVYTPDLGSGILVNGVADARREFGRRIALGLNANW